MRRFFSGLSGLVACALLPAAALASNVNIADFPLRVHVVQNNNHTHYRDRMMDWVDGEGRANLYENGMPRGFDYGFRCNDRVRLSEGYETYPARWKKAGRELEILQPIMGKPGAVWGCTLKVDMKDNVFVRHNGLVEEQPAAKLKEWMDRRQYDPEHGKNQPEPPPAPAGTNATPGGEASPQ
jgi:hypothetical protein